MSATSSPVDQAQGNSGPPSVAPDFNPFNFSKTDANAPGLLGLSPSTWQDIARFGANLASGANARTAQGFLANGPGLAGPLGAAVSGTLDQNRANAVTRSGLARQGAETTGLNLQNQITSLGLPFQKALAGARMGALQGMMPPDQSAPTGPPGLAAAESGNNPRSINSAGYSGMFQFGAPRLAELGVYTPAQGEDLTSNKWGGTFNIPGFPDVKTQADFLKNPQAQNAAYGIHMQNIDQSIGSTPGASQFDPNGLRAVAHLGGVGGMQRFVQTGGQYDPADSNGTHLSDYYRKFSGGSSGSPATGPRVQPTGIGSPGLSQPPATLAATAGTLPPTSTGPGNYAPTYQPATTSAPSAPGQPAPNQPQQPMPGSPDARALAQRLRGEAQNYTMQANRAALVGSGIGGDPTLLRTTAMEKLKLADQLETAGPMETAKGVAGAPFKLERAAPGTIVYDSNGRVVGSSPHESTETVQSGPNKGMPFTVLRSPVDNSLVGGGGTPGADGLPPGAIPKGLPPSEQGRLTAAGQVEGQDLEHDRKMVETDLSHVIDNTIQGKLQMLKLRTLIDPAATGFMGDTRMAFKNAIQTLSPSFADAIDVNASPAQELKKIATMGAGKSEREDQGAKGGLRLMQIYMEANPNLENQPESNQHMANMILMAHQLHEDYALGANDFYQKNRDNFVGPDHGTYQPISKYDQTFIQKMRPELYKSATDALNGQPYTTWSKGLTGPQMQIVGGILQRADPNAAIDLQGQKVPVSAFKKTIGPTDISGGQNGN